jgi:diguanylate cyclase (GGDEF)-like protein
MHIYLIEVENYARQLVAQCLRDQGHRVSLLPAPADLLGPLAAELDPADLVIADLAPGSGRPTGEALRRFHRRCPTVPVFLRASSELLPSADAVHCGVYGYLSKPFQPDELELMLVRVTEQQAILSFQDPASGMYHRAGFAVLARQQLKAARRTRTQMILLRADVDGDGLEQVERAITELGYVVRRTFRDADMAGRVDGTDCGVLLVNAGADQSDIALSRLEANLAAHNARAGVRQQLTVRVGVAYFDPDRPCSFEELVAQADVEKRS